ncbi:MAG: hemerythrin family protein [Gammaproteobacteria bacterium]|nr:hemerythrin family protein [Gammaproteobacteria bacterium]
MSKLLLLITVLLATIVSLFIFSFSHPLPWVFITSLAFITYINKRSVSHDYILWNAAMDTGIEPVDNDHKKLLSLINQLQTATQYHIDDQIIGKIMDELLSYTQYHFEREELLMRTNNYPDYENHKRQHEKMIKMVRENIDRYHSDPLNTADETLSFLKNWLINHIMGSDREYIPYLKNSDAN